MLEIDGSQYSGSGTIVRQAVAFAALMGKAVRIVNVRLRRPKPGLRRQHVLAVEAIRQLVGGTTEGVVPGSKEFVFLPDKPRPIQHYAWDIGSAGSTTALALAVLPVLTFASCPVSVELRGGLFQDFAPSFYHLEHVLLPFLRRMGINVTGRMERPGYVPTGGGIVHLEVTPVRKTLQPLVLDNAGGVEKVWGIALSSRLQSQSVSDRMADAVKIALAAAGHSAQIRVLYDDTALQPGAGLAVFAELSGGSRLGSDRAGAPGRRSEAIGKYVARQLLEDLKTKATLDRHASDQIIPFAALASGESKFRIPHVTEHIQSNAWLSEQFLGAKISIEGNDLVVRGVGFHARSV
jgi:RNA 3'-terminal phosphate cyclase (ATP)